MCGVLGITGHPQAKLVFPTFLMSLQHRGHDAAGMAGFISDEPKCASCIGTVKSLGKVSSIITPSVMRKFSGHTFIGHTRYSTRNQASSDREIHPHLAQSIHGKFGQSNYTAAKAGVIGYTKSIARELGAFNVNVNAVAPGLIETPMIKESDARDKIVDMAMKEIVMQRVGQPEDLANVVAFLASDKARHITGEVIKVDGGQYI